MHRLARIVPVLVVAVFLGFVVALLVMAKTRTAAVEPISAPGPATADLQIKHVEIEEQSGSVRWRLTAKQALVYEKQRRSVLQDVSVLVEDGDRTWTIAAEEGDVVERDEKLRDMEVRRNVVVTSSDGYRLETSVLRFDAAARRLWTDAPIRLTRGRTVIRGATFEFLLGEETATLSRVRATFTPPRERT